MTDRYRVAIAKAAVEDLREIGSYIAHRDSAEAARRQLIKLRTKLTRAST